jgi:putative flippase GtrA
MSSNTKHEVLKFLIVGCSCVAVDYLTYLTLLHLGVKIPVAKMIGFLMGTTCTYFANRFWTFKARQSTGRSTIGPFLVVYAASLSLNIGVNQGILIAFQFPYVITVAFVIAAGLSAALNFVGMKFFVFK